MRTTENIEVALKDLEESSKIGPQPNSDKTKWTKLEWQTYYQGQISALKWMLSSAVSDVE